MDKYEGFIEGAKRILAAKDIYTDYMHRLAWGTDASFYRLIPQVVVRPHSEEQVSELLRLADRLEVPLTFRASGTSLSGQAVSDSVLVLIDTAWDKLQVTHDEQWAVMQPGVIGGAANELLARRGLRLPPDPASVKSASIGGIVANNASGMNCGTHANSDRMLQSARIILADGTLVDTGDPTSRAAFALSHATLLEEIARLRDRTRADKPLAERIRRKYAIKNVTGLNILPFLEHDDPIDILAHLMVGSEGTLAFLAEVTMKLEKVSTHRATAMLYFATMEEACHAVVAMKRLKHRGEPTVKSAEMLDYKSLSSVDDAVYLRWKQEQADPSGLTALLTEVKAFSQEELEGDMQQVEECLAAFSTCQPVRFAQDAAEQARYWQIRSGIFPSVGGTRRPGTTCLIEDVAFPIDVLPQATVDLQQLIARHGYTDACIYGHALEGNYHFIINQSFDSEAEVARYEALMEEVKQLVVDKYDGSLKAEHGTGRNMAPYVRYEWGESAFQLMKDIKRLFDPKGLLNPGVIFNDDPRCHVKHLKPLPLLAGGETLPQTEEDDSRIRLAQEVHQRVNRCIECGFCEVNCLSCGLTLSSRQRIVLRREISRLMRTGENPALLKELEKAYRYAGNETCAGDGLCSTSCPMGINVADLTHLIRQENLPVGSAGYRLGNWVAGHFSGVKQGMRGVLQLADTTHTLLGTSAMTAMTSTLHRWMGMPLWCAAMPKAYRISPTLKETTKEHTPAPLKVVYFPSCINQSMGLAKHSPVKQPLVEKTVALLHKAGYEVIFPEGMEKLCCGTIWESKGMTDIADRKVAELEDSLWKASEEGRWPVLCDQSPCLHRMRKCITRMKLYEPVEFIYTFLRDRLVFHPIQRPVVVHITCSMREMGLGNMLVSLARLCSEKVVVPDGVGCCGFAGDRGFTHPELNAYALRRLAPQVRESGATVGYSNSRTCEIGLATHSGIPYVSIVYLVDEVTSRKS